LVVEIETGMLNLRKITRGISKWDFKLSGGPAFVVGDGSGKWKTGKSRASSRFADARAGFGSHMYGRERS